MESALDFTVSIERNAASAGFLTAARHGHMRGGESDGETSEA
jgi:hypothetical protein